MPSMRSRIVGCVVGARGQQRDLKILLRRSVLTMRFTWFALLVLTATILTAYCGNDGALTGNQCSRTYLGRLNSGVIASYNYPFDYGDNLTCTYRIYMDLNPNLTRTICFTFFRFDLETSSPFCSFDYLSFGFPLPVKYCCGGIWQYGQEDSRNVLSSVWSRNLCWVINATSLFELTFSSDNTVHKSGFFTRFQLYDSWENAILSQGRNLSSTVTACHGDTWMCFNRKCVNNSLLCNGRDDCGDGSDETYAHARCIGSQNILACDFASSGSEEGICGLTIDGWSLSSYLQFQGVVLQDHTPGIGGNFLNSSRRGARAISPRVALNASASYCLTFWYYVVAGSSHPLVVYVSSEQAYVHPEWNHGNTRGRWTMGEVYISQRPSVQVIFSADNQDNGLGLVAIDDISILEGVCSGVDISCNFESSTCGWSSLKQLNYRGGFLQADVQWTIEHNGSLGRDYSSIDGSGYYLFVELPAVNFMEKRQGLMLSPPISGEIGELKCLHFAFIVKSSNNALDCRLSIALLRHDNALTADVWNHSADGVETWRRADISFVADGPFQIMLSATKTSQDVCQVFLDQIYLENNYCVTDAPCRENEFRCGDNHCIIQTLVCDQIFHCYDGSDESSSAGCLTTQTTVDQQCQNDPSKFSCQNGLQCIPLTSVCDGISDCSDFSDEIPFGDCSKTIPKSHTEKPTLMITSSVLSSPTYSSSGCNVNQFRCSDGRCLDAGKVCDERFDCSDGLDEQHCSVNSLTSSTRSSVLVSCSHSQLVCLSESKCLLQSQLCDGRKDCSDGSDETQCRAVMPLNSNAIGGIVAGCIICMLIIICGVFLVRKLQEKSRKSSIESQTSVDVSTVFSPTSNHDQPFEPFGRTPSLLRPQLPPEWNNMQLHSVDGSQKEVLHTRPTSWVYHGRRLRTTLPFVFGEKTRAVLSENVQDPTEATREFSRNKLISRSLPPIPTATANMSPLLEALLEHQRKRHHHSNNSAAGFLDLSVASEHIYEEPVFSESTESPLSSTLASHSVHNRSADRPNFQAATQNSPRSAVFSNWMRESLVDRRRQSPSGILPPSFKSNIPEVPDVPISDQSREAGPWEQSAHHERFPSSSSLLLSPNLLEGQTQRVRDDFGPLQVRDPEEWNAMNSFQCSTNSGLNGNRSVSSCVPGCAMLNLDNLPNGTSV